MKLGGEDSEDRWETQDERQMYQGYERGRSMQGGERSSDEYVLEKLFCGRMFSPGFRAVEERCATSSS